MKMKKKDYVWAIILFLILQPLLIACTDRGTDARRELKSYGIEYSGKAFLDAIRFGHTQVVRLFLDAGMSPNTRQPERGTTGLMFAVMSGSPEMAKMLLDSGAKVNTQSDQGDSALMYAVISPRQDIVSMLIEHGADVDAGTREGETALMKAAKYGHLKTVELLIEHGADANAQDAEGFTALSKAKKNGYTEIVRFLESAGVRR
jgi:ankyrin repeat protein